MLAKKTHIFGLRILFAVACLLLLFIRNQFSFLPVSRSPSSERGTDTSLKNTTNQSKRAFVLFLEAPLNEAARDEDDIYYIATRTLGYQLMHAPETRTNSAIDFVVIVTPDVTERKKRRLEQDGAKVVPVERVPGASWMDANRTAQGHGVWTKMRIFQLTDYDLCLCLDADMLVTKPLDGVFDDPGARIQQPRDGSIGQDEANLPPTYLLAGQAMQTAREHPYPPDPYNEWFCAGFILYQPSETIFQYYMTLKETPDLYDPLYPDQNMLSYAHRRDGPMPWAEVFYTWTATYPTYSDYESGAATIHEKLWYNWPEDQNLGTLPAMWKKAKWDMEFFYRNRDYEAPIALLPNAEIR